MASAQENDSTNHMSYKDALVEGVPELEQEIHKEREEDASFSKDEGKDDGNLKSTLIITGAVIAVIGAIFAIVKNMKASN